MKEIRISVVIPVYNIEKYLGRCLKSVVEQNLKEIEIIVVNDGSPDSSYKIIEEFKKKDRRIKVLNQENKGVSEARNQGIKESRGEYVLFIDGDDWIEENYLKNIYEKAKSENLDIVVTDILWDFDNGKIIYGKDFDIFGKDYIIGKELVKNIIDGRSFPMPWNKLFRKELFIKNNILFPKGIGMGEDLATITKLAFFAEKVGKIDKAYVHYIQNQNSATKNNPTKKVYELVSVFEILDKFFKENNFQISKFNESRITHISGLLFNPNYNYKDEYYRKAIEYYIGLHKKQKYKFKGRKLNIYSKILNKKPTFKTFELLYKFNNLGIKIKKLIN